MRNFEGRMENMSTIYLIDSHGTLAGAVPLVKIVLAPPDHAAACAEPGAAYLHVTKTRENTKLLNSSTSTTC